MTTYTTLMILSGLIIFSYLFDLIASRTRMPSVLLLVLLGIGLKFVVSYFGISTFNFFTILPALGTVGLILIVFEGGLELDYDKQKNLVIRRSLLAALFILLVTVAGITYVFHKLTGADWYTAFANSIPFSVISSSIAIPSAAGLSKAKKEFVVYESSFSDILGIILFNFAISHRGFAPSAALSLMRDTLIVLAFSVVSCLFLLFIIGRIRHHVKFFLIIAILVMIYAIGQTYYLSSLVLVLFFGIFLNNADQIRNTRFRNIFIYPSLQKDLKQLHQLSAESAFILRTFFFVIFGFTMDLNDLKETELFATGFIILALIYICRFAYLRFTTKGSIAPQAFITPRGLISILLYYKLPDDLKIPEISTGLLFLVVIGTGVVMSIGIMAFGRDKALPPQDIRNPAQ